MTTLSQRLGIGKRIWTIDKKSLRFSYKQLLESSEEITPFEEITNDISYKTETSPGFLVAAGIFSIFVAACVLGRIKGLDMERYVEFFWLIPVIACLILYFVSVRRFKFLHLTNGSRLSFYKNKPSEKTVNDFIEQLFKARNNYLLKEYGEMDINLGYAILKQKLHYLRSLDVISEADYNAKIQWLRSSFDIIPNQLDESGQPN